VQNVKFLTKPDAFFFLPQHKVGTILVTCEKIKAVKKVKVAPSLRRAESNMRDDPWYCLSPTHS